MWDPILLTSYCDRCEVPLSQVHNDYHMTMHTIGSRNAPAEIPEDLKDLLRGFGFKAPDFCPTCTLPVMRLVLTHCQEFKRDRAKAKEEVEATRDQNHPP